VELLGGPLSGASYIFDDGDWGTFFMAFSPNLLGDTKLFKKNASDLISKLRKAKTKSGEPIHIPGYDTFEKSDKLFQEDGFIEIDDEIFSKLKALDS